MSPTDFRFAAPSFAAAPGAERSPALRRVVHFFENIAPEDIKRIGEYYTEDAFFKDPFSEVRGAAAIGRIFGHMFEQVREPRFTVHDCIGGDSEAFLIWDFTFRRAAGQTMQIRGASHLRLDPLGLIHWHRDYWDAAEELYEKLPVLGALMRWLKRRI